MRIINQYNLMFDAIVALVGIVSVSCSAGSDNFPETEADSSESGCSTPCSDGSGQDGADDEDLWTWSTVTLPRVVVDDYRADDPPWGGWYYSRIGTDRGRMGSTANIFPIGGGGAHVQVGPNGGWMGVWTSLMHNANDADTLDPQNLLGPLIKPQYQVHLIGVEVDASGTGQFKIELKGAQDEIIIAKTFTLDGSATLFMAVDTQQPLKLLNWLLDGPGDVIVNALRLVVESDHSFTTAEAAFLWSYGHMSQAYDPVSHLVRDRANWPTGDFDAVQATGMFALATATAADLGYVDTGIAADVVSDIAAKLAGLDVCEGLLPHFLTDEKITNSTEWSSVDTILALLATMLACQSTGCDTAPIEVLLSNIAWDTLTDSSTVPMSHGFAYGCDMLASRWDTWGSESLLVVAAHAGAQGLPLPLTFVDSEQPKTWDGSGFNDELANLFFPMTGIDVWGVDWADFRVAARQKQLSHFSEVTYDADYENIGLFGLSACEIPEPWAASNENEVYQVLGVGGFNNGGPVDGTTVLGYPFVCPHYGAMIAADEPAAYDQMMKFLIETAGVFTPLNNVESIGVDTTNTLVWNELKGSWNLSLQTLGAARAVYAGKKGDYLPYKIGEPFWSAAFQIVMP
ncbi:MAG: hypothetical protein HUU55_15725 [Myxococcales bacterium]|nr:hypothetical protein [Myxococcales bacterium]